MLILLPCMLHLRAVNLSYWNSPIGVFTPRRGTLSKRIFLLAGNLVFNSKGRNLTKPFKGVLSHALNVKIQIIRDGESTIC